MVWEVKGKVIEWTHEDMYHKEIAESFDIRINLCQLFQTKKLNNAPINLFDQLIYELIIITLK